MECFHWRKFLVHRPITWNALHQGRTAPSLALISTSQHAIAYCHALCWNTSDASSRQKPPQHLLGLIVHAVTGINDEKSSPLSFSWEIWSRLQFVWPLCMVPKINNEGFWSFSFVLFCCSALLFFDLTQRFGFVLAFYALKSMHGRLPDHKCPQFWLLGLLCSWNIVGSPGYSSELGCFSLRYSSQETDVVISGALTVETKSSFRTQILIFDGISADLLRFTLSSILKSRLKSLML